MVLSKITSKFEVTKKNFEDKGFVIILFESLNNTDDIGFYFTDLEA